MLEVFLLLTVNVNVNVTFQHAYSSSIVVAEFAHFLWKSKRAPNEKLKPSFAD